MTIAEGRNHYHGVNGILTHYHIHCYPYLVIGGFDLIITPRDCIEWKNTMDLTWHPSLLPMYHPRYYLGTKPKYYPILGKHNDWVMTDLFDKAKYEYEQE